MSKKNIRHNHKNIWKRILAGLGVIVILSDPVGTSVWQLKAADVTAEYAETESFETEIEDAENLESEKNEIDIQEYEDVAEQSLDDLEEEEQILDGQEDTGSLDEQIQKAEASLNWKNVEVLDNTEIVTEESAEAGTALNGGNLTGRNARRVRMAVQFQNCYGDQLNTGSREVYDAMEDAWADGGTEVFHVKFQEPLTFQATGTVENGTWKWIGSGKESNEEKMQLDPAYGEMIEALRSYVQGGFDACIYDHPEIFWLKRVGFTYGLTWEKQKDGTMLGKISTVTISGNEAWTGAKNCVEEFQNKVKDAVDCISEGFTEDMSDARKMKQIHDYICAKCVYQEGTYAHSAYGTFYNGKVVCEGYAKAFKILCNRMGLTCVLGSGTVHKTSSDGAHMWNYVLLDGGWYMVDVTWDDGNTLSNRYLFAGSESDGVYYKISEERTNYVTFSTKLETAFRFVQPSLETDMYHEYEAWKISLLVYCGSHMTGEKTTACVLCGDRKTISYEAAEEHQYGEWKTTPATCETDGERVRVCQNCQKAEKEILPATGHLYGEWKTTPATCETDGVQIRTCQTCKKTETKIVSAIGHRYGEWQTVCQATVLEEGEMQRGCENPGCTSMQTRRLDRLPHYIQLNTSNMILQIKQSTTGLKVTDMAEGDRIISWKSSKPTVATVSKTGKIAAKKVGTTIITVTLASGATANVKVKVQKKAVQPVSLRIVCSRLKSNRITLKKGQRTTCKVTVSPFTCKTKVTFSSANPKIVKVSGNGKIIARKAGKTKITVKAGKKKKVIWVTVKKVK